MTNASSTLDLEAEIDGLYQGPLDRFVEARNALATRAKALGDKQGATRVKSLARPSVSAWVVNQAYWTQRNEFDALVACAGRVREAQLEGGEGAAALREAMKARREALDRMVATAASLLASAGHGANPATLLRVSKTLEALAAAGGEPAGGQAGRLADDLEPPGFEALAGLALAGPTPPPKGMISTTGGPAARAPGAGPPAPPAVAESKHDLGAEEAERLAAALALAEQRLERARRESREAAGALSVAGKRAEAARAELQEASRRLERAQERAHATAEDETAARIEAEGRASALEAAEADRDAALLALRAAQ
jgi:hypothetical protein